MSSKKLNNRSSIVKKSFGKLLFPSLVLINLLSLSSLCFAQVDDQPSVEAAQACYQLGYRDGYVHAQPSGRRGTVGSASNYCRRLGVTPSQSYGSGFSNGFVDGRAAEAEHEAAQSRSPSPPSSTRSIPRLSDDGGCLVVVGPGRIARCY
jgi:hypothetical protein